MSSRIKQKIEIQDAMDNLAAIVGIDMGNPPPIGIVKKNRIVTSEEEFGPDTVQWLSGEGSSPILDILDLTYRAIHQHLMNLYEDPEMNWENAKTEKGIAAMMDLVGESASRIQEFLEFRMGEALPQKVDEREEFQSLQKFYSRHFRTRFEGGIEGKEAWSKNWGEDEEEDAVFLDVTNTGLKDFETVRRDLEYELFYIRREDGKPYFGPEMLRNIKLSCDFDLDGDSFEEDPLLQVRTMQDRDLHASAGQILTDSHALIEEYYKHAHGLDGNELSMALGMGVIALFLAANPRYLIQNTMGKSCLQYFNDFHMFLRRALKTSEYQKLIAYPPDKTDKVSHMLMQLSHSLCKGLFERVGGVKMESIGLIHRTMRRGEEEKKKEHQKLYKGDEIWTQFSLDDEKMRSLLAKFPNGPLFKILDLIREEQDEDTNIPFDPIGQQNLPMKLFHIEKKGKKIKVLRIPSPTRQAVIHKTEVVDEFRGFLRSLSMDKTTDKHLIVNLQDRTSWKEFARAKAIETLQMNAEFNSQLIVMSLPKDTDFYYQNHEYLNMGDADAFMNAFIEQFATPEECGIFLPASLKKTEFTRFVELAIPRIHTLFFDGKKTLSRHNREDFIEIFYQFLTLKCLEMVDPSSMSFTCKDAVDTGAAATGAFYGFLKLLDGDLKEKKDQDLLRWILYTPALFIRERVIDPERVNRTISMLQKVSMVMSTKREEVFQQFGELLKPETLKSKI